MYLDEKRQGEVAAPVESWRQVLLDAADYIEQYGWTQGWMFDGDKACMLGAMSYVARGGLPSPFDPPPHPASMKLHIFLGIPITKYNDAPYRTKAEVLAALRDCARQP